MSFKLGDYVKHKEFPKSNVPLQLLEEWHVEVINAYADEYEYITKKEFNDYWGISKEKEILKFIREKQKELRKEFDDTVKEGNTEKSMFNTGANRAFREVINFIESDIKNREDR